MTKSTTAKAATIKPDAQLERFKEAARQAECDEDEAHWDEKLAKIAKQKPEPEKGAPE